MNAQHEPWKQLETIQALPEYKAAPKKKLICNVLESGTSGLLPIPGMTPQKNILSVILRGATGMVNAMSAPDQAIREAEESLQNRDQILSANAVILKRNMTRLAKGMAQVFEKEQMLQKLKNNNL